MSAEASVFDCVCVCLEETTSLSRLEARGTVRLALKQAGLEADSVSVGEMRVVIAQVLPSELESRGIESAEICPGLRDKLVEVARSDAAVASPAEIFRHLARDRDFAGDGAD